MPDRHDGPPGWVESPDLPDPRQWSAPPTRDDRAATPGWHDRSAPPPAPPRPGAPGGPPGSPVATGTTAWRRVLPWLAVLGIVAAFQVPRLLVDRALDLDGHARPPGEDVAVRYAASEGSLGEVAFAREGDPLATDRATHEALWAEWTALVPASWARRVETFEIASDGTGNGSFTAYVEPLDVRGDRWLLAVDPVDAADRPELYHATLVHELAHVLTLGDGVRSGGPFPDLATAMAACDGAAVRSGCVAPDSLVGRFVAAFWTDADVAAADEVHAAGPARFADVVADRHAERSSSFVSPYALTDPAEDIAETVVALADGRSQPPGSVAEAKVDFLRQDAQLVALVDRVRATLHDL